MNQTINLFGEADKQTKLSDVTNFTFDFRAGWVGAAVIFPRIACTLLETKRDAAFREIDIKNHNLNLLAGGYDLSGVNIFLCPAHF